MSADPVSVPLRARDGSVRAVALIDAEDAARINRWRWSLVESRSGVGYAVRGAWVDGRNHTRSMHREVLGLPMEGDGREADHVNGDGLDNRHANLRVVTHAQNHQNKRDRIGNSPSPRGVTCRRGTRWIAQATLRGRHHYIGSFGSAEEASAAAAEWRAANMPYAQPPKGASPAWDFRELPPTQPPKRRAVKQAALALDLLEVAG